MSFRGCDSSHAGGWSAWFGATYKEKTSQKITTKTSCNHNASTERKHDMKESNEIYLFFKKLVLT
jgi:hypothetical protein